MVDNGKSLINHIAKLFNLNVEYDITKYAGRMLFKRRDSIFYRTMFTLYHDKALCYKPITNKFCILDSNTRSFINHWAYYSNFADRIYYVHIRKYHYNLKNYFNIRDIVISLENKCYCITYTGRSTINTEYDWIAYKW